MLNTRNDMKKTLTSLLLALAMLAGKAHVTETTALEGNWSGQLKAGTISLTLVLHIEQADGHVACTLDSPDQGALGFTCSNEYVSDDSIALKIEKLGVAYQAKLKDGKLEGIFSQMGAQLPLTMDRERELRRPQNPAPPYPYKTREVTFTNETDHATLAGTLTYPVGYESMKKGSVPVALMVTGSGQENRDEEIFDHKPFWVIADHLARNGIATLRYDDRGYGQSVGGDLQHATSLDFKRDAEAGIRFLRDLNEFGRIGVLGHSEGGCIAFMLSGEKAVDFAISLAGVGVKGDTALTAQANRLMELQGGVAVPLSVEQYRKNVQQLQSDWINWFIDYDPAADLAATRCPVMAINGDRDIQVISGLNLNAIKQNLPHNAKSMIKEYPGLNHLFQHCETGLPSEYRSTEETIAPEVLHDIAAWLNSL